MKIFKIDSLLPKKYFLIIILWFLSLLLVGYIGLQIIPHTEINKDFIFPRQWSNWDGNNYISIATVGYQATGLFSYAFFPLYPLLISLSSFIVPFPFIVAWLISIISFTGSIIILRKLILLDFPENIFRDTLLFLLLFPASFFFFATYTESLFLFLLLSSIYFYRKEKYLLSTLLALLTCATRTTGLGLILFFIYEIVISKKRTALSFLPIVGSVIGFASYMVYIFIIKQDLFFFFHIQESEFHRAVIVFPLQTLLGILKNWIVDNTNIFSNWFLGIMFAEVICSWIFLSLILIGFIRKIRISYLLFALFAWSLPLTTGTPSSMLRYVIVLFPCFITLALLLKNKNSLRYFIYILSAIGLILATMYFLNGYWIG